MTTSNRERIDTPTPSPQPPVPFHRRLAVCLATGLGVGSTAPAPGTVGTAVWGLPFAWEIGQLPGVGWQMAAIVIAFLIGVPLTTAANRALGVEKDNQAIIWDEIATLPVVFLWIPMTNWKVALIGFGLHRLFDITKPPPARQLEQLPEGMGVMADDLMAAIYACAALGLIRWLDGGAGWNLLSTIGR